MNFGYAAKRYGETKFTENGAMAYSTTENDLLDLFSQIGSLRNRSESEIETKFAKAFKENSLLATKMMFYCGNVHGGLGERRTFRICLKWLAQNYPSIVIDNIDLVPLFNRYDSLFVLIGTRCEKAMWDFIINTMTQDMKNFKMKKPYSLLAKWMPSENTSSQKTRILAKKARMALGLSSKEYRKVLTALRKGLNIVESKISANEWNKVIYSTVPSYAMLRYRNAFKMHDYERFQKYLDNVKTGKVKINSSTLYPYDLVHKYSVSGYIPQEDSVIEEQWKALPNYIEGENNILIMADVSSSMYGRPIETSIGLATYFAQRNNGAYSGLYMTFTNKPHFISIGKNDSLRDSVVKVQHTDIGYSTNLEAAFRYILNFAISNRVAPHEMPSALVVISDMEIDRYLSTHNFDFLQMMEKMFNSYGYNLPKIILWNVEARNDTFLSQDDKVIFVSGQSPSVFERLCGALEGKTAADFMWETLNDSMYDSLYFDEHLL